METLTASGSDKCDCQVRVRFGYCSIGSWSGLDRHSAAVTFKFPYGGLNKRIYLPLIQTDNRATQPYNPEGFYWSAQLCSSNLTVILCNIRGSSGQRRGGAVMHGEISPVILLQWQQVDCEYGSYILDSRIESRVSIQRQRQTRMRSEVLHSAETFMCTLTLIIPVSFAVLFEIIQISLRQNDERVNYQK